MVSEGRTVDGRTTAVELFIPETSSACCSHTISGLEDLTCRMV